MSNIDNMVEGLRTGLKKQRPQNHPIEGHPIAETDEYIRKIYFDMLCVIAQYACDDAEKRLAFVERIHTGSGLKTEFSEHIKNAMNIAPDKLDDFFKQCRENDLTVNFIIDGLLIACADGKPNSKQTAFAAEMAEALGLKKEEVEVLSKLAIAILEQDNDKYFAVMESAPEKSKEKIVHGVFCYIKDFVSGVLVDNKNLFWLYSVTPTEFEHCESLDSFHNKIIFENQVFGDFYEFTKANELYLINCTSKHGIYFDNIAKTNIIGCGFEEMEDIYAVNLTDCGNVNITNCRFINNKRTANHTAIINFKNIGDVQVTNSNFFNICHESDCAAIVYDYNECNSLTISNCTFSSCKGRSLFGNGSLIGMFRTRKEVKFTLENNTYKNCCKVTDRD